jgi:transmembrane sensor
MTESDRFWLLVSRKLANEASRANLAELEQMIASHPDYQARYEALFNYWQQADRKREVDVNAALQKTLHTLHTEETPSKKRFFIKRKSYSIWLGIAASFALLFLLLPNLRHFTFHQHNEKAMRSEILLSDGSIIWLNADSEISYPEVFSPHIREIHLSGEAYFDIAHDPARPFIIHLDNNLVSVLGTSFNVKAYEEDDVVETSVVSGEVAFIRQGIVASKNQKDTLLLTPNYKALYSKRAGTLTKTETDTRLDTAWKDGILIFRSARFEEAGKILERTFGKEVVFSDQSIKLCRLTATFQNNSLEEIMILIAKTNDYTYDITEEQLTISGQGCP